MPLTAQVIAHKGAQIGFGLRAVTGTDLGTGTGTGRGIVLLHELGLSRAQWDALVPLLPVDASIVAMDLRGHGDSAVAPCSMGALISDAEAVIDAVQGPDRSVIIGAGVGGMIAQGLAVKRPDLCRALVLANTAPKLATPTQWAARIDAVTAQGMEAEAARAKTRWGMGDDARSALLRTSPDGFTAVAQAAAGSDFFLPVQDLRLPVLCIAGDRDGDTPPDLVRELAELIPGAEFALMRGWGHLPALSDPQGFAALVNEFVRSLDVPKLKLKK